MLLKLLGKILFRKSPPWQQRRHVNTTLVVLLISLCFAICLGAVIYWVNTGHH
jgi:hypothetical protein